MEIFQCKSFEGLIIAKFESFTSDKSEHESVNLFKALKGPSSKIRLAESGLIQ